VIYRAAAYGVASSPSLAHFVRFFLFFYDPFTLARWAQGPTSWLPRPRARRRPLRFSTVSEAARVSSSVFLRPYALQVRTPFFLHPSILRRADTPSVKVLFLLSLTTINFFSFPLSVFLLDWYRSQNRLSPGVLSWYPPSIVYPILSNT